MVVHTYNPSPWEAEKRNLLSGYSGLERDPVSKRITNIFSQTTKETQRLPYMIIISFPLALDWWKLKEKIFHVAEKNAIFVSSLESMKANKQWNTLKSSLKIMHTHMCLHRYKYLYILYIQLNPKMCSHWKYSLKVK
jgi:hypothetical protein